MSWLTAALRSTVGKKFVMGFTGLFLCFFLVVHLAGNMLLWVGADAYNHYAHALHEQAALLIASEVILYLAFAAHIYLAIVTTRENWAARESRYAMKQSKRDAHTVNVAGYVPSNTMFVTGTIILGFLILHLWDFKFEIGWSEIEGREPYDKAVVIMSDTIRMVLYAIGSLAVGIHVAHGLASAFQSLGMNHPKYNRPLEKISVLFAIIVGVGFIAFSFWGFSHATRSDTEADVPPAAIEQQEL